MLTKSVNSVISVELKQVAKKSVQSVRSVSYNIIRIVSSASHNLIYAKVPAPCTFAFYELIIKELCSVGTSALCLHLLALILHLSALACTVYTHLALRLHSSRTACTHLTLRLHLPALTFMIFPGHCYELQHREVEKTFGSTENSTTLCTHTALAQP